MIGYYDKGKTVLNELTNVEPFNWSVRSSSRKRGNRVKGEIVILASHMFHFIGELENPSNSISI